MINLTAYQLSCFIISNGFRKARAVKTSAGEFRYNVKGLTEAEWSLFDIGGEDVSPADAEKVVERGGWFLLDAYTASAVKAVYEALKRNPANDLSKFNTLSYQTLANFAFKMSK